MGLIRLLLALAVALHHWQFAAPFPLPIFGRTAVQCFFVISGFYMTLALSTRDGGGDVSVRNFYLSRFLRIFPPYWIFLILTLLLSNFDDNNAYVGFSADGSVWHSENIATIAAVAISNCLIFFLDVLRFTIYDPSTGALAWTSVWDADIKLWGSGLAVLGQAWSLSTELWFYLLAPFILTKSVKSIVVTCGLSFAIRWQIAELGLGGQNWFNAFFPSELGIFLAGVLAGRLYLRRKLFFESSKNNPPALAMLAGWLIAFATCRQWPRGFIEFGNEWLFVALTLVVLPWVFGASTRFRLDGILGRMSYIVYLNHILLGGIIAKLNVSGGTRVWLALAGTIAIGYVCHLLIEQPLDVVRHSRFDYRMGRRRISMAIS